MNIEPDFPNKLFIPHSLTLFFQTWMVSHQSLLKLNPSISAFLKIPKISSKSPFPFWLSLSLSGLKVTQQLLEDGPVPHDTLRNE